MITGYAVECHLTISLFTSASVSMNNRGPNTKIANLWNEIVAGEKRRVQLRQTWLQDLYVNQELLSKLKLKLTYLKMGIGGGSMVKKLSKEIQIQGTRIKVYASVRVNMGFFAFYLFSDN